MFLLLCIVIILLEELLALSMVTVGGNVKAGGELLACLCTCITTGHHTLPLATLAAFCTLGSVRAVCAPHFAAALYFAYCLLAPPDSVAINLVLAPYAGI